MVRRITTPVLAVVVGVLVIGAGAVKWVRPYVTQQRVVRSGTPVPPAIFNLSHVELPGGGHACLTDVTFDTDAQIARFNAGTFGKPGPRLVVTAGGPGYRQRTVVPAGWGDEAGLAVPLTPPRHSLRGTFCIRNASHRKIALNATAEPRGLARAETHVNGQVVPADVALEFDRARPQALSHHVGEIFRRAMLFTWRPLGMWFAWGLAVVLLLLVPLGTLFALADAIRSDQRAQERSTRS